MEMEEEKIDKPKPDVPYIVYESEIARMERINKRFWVLIITLVALLCITNGAWLYYESQMEVVETTVTQENTDGTNNYNYIGNDGDITNGETNRQNQESNP